METKWTMGPWSIPGQPDKICAEGFTRNGAAKAIATAHTPSWMAGSEPWANAHLISAAPDLYAALDDALRKIRKLGLDHWWLENALDADDIEAILAKARGEA